MPPDRLRPPPARSAIEGHLQRVEAHLCAAKTPANERDEVLASVAAQYQDFLGKPYIEANQTDIGRALAQLPVPDSYFDRGEFSVKELLALLWCRLVPHGSSISTCYVDRKGRRQILWNILGLRLVAFVIFLASGASVVLKLTRPDQPLFNPLTTLVLIWIGVLTTYFTVQKTRRIPLDQLPREHELSPDLRFQAIIHFVITLLTSVATLTAGWAGLYSLLGFLQRQTLWPFSPELFGQSVIYGSLLGILIAALIQVRHRRTRQRIQQLI